MPLLILIVALVVIVFVIRKAKTIANVSKGLSLIGEATTDPRVYAAVCTYSSLNRHRKAGLIRPQELLRQMWSEYPDVMAKYPDLTNEVLKEAFSQGEKT